MYENPKETRKTQRKQRRQLEIDVSEEGATSNSHTLPFPRSTQVNSSASKYEKSKIEPSSDFTEAVKNYNEDDPDTETISYTDYFNQFFSQISEEPDLNSIAPRIKESNDIMDTDLIRYSSDFGIYCAQSSKKRLENPESTLKKGEEFNTGFMEDFKKNANELEDCSSGELVNIFQEFYSKIIEEKMLSQTPKASKSTNLTEGNLWSGYKTSKNSQSLSIKNVNGSYDSNAIKVSKKLNFVD